MAHLIVVNIPYVRLDSWLARQIYSIFSAVVPLKGKPTLSRSRMLHSSLTVNLEWCGRVDAVLVYPAAVWVGDFDSLCNNCTPVDDARHIRIVV